MLNRFLYRVVRHFIDPRKWRNRFSWHYQRYYILIGIVMAFMNVFFVNQYLTKEPIFSKTIYFGTASPDASRKLQKLRQESWTPGKGYHLSDAPLFIALLKQTSNEKMADAVRTAATEASRNGLSFFTVTFKLQN